MINVDKVLELRDSDLAQHQELLSTYERLQQLFSSCADDEEVQVIFEYDIR